MGGLRVRVSANQPRPARIRRDFSHDADHLWGTGAFLLRQGHYVHTTTGGRHSRAASAEPRRLPQLDATPAVRSDATRAAHAAASPLGLSQSAVFEYDSPGATTLATQQAIKREAQQLPLSPDARTGPASAQVLRNLDRYMERWAATGQTQVHSPPPMRPQRATSPTRRTATEVGAELILRTSATGAESRIGMARQLSPSRMRDRQTSAAYGACVATLRR